MLKIFLFYLFIWTVIAEQPELTDPDMAWAFQKKTDNQQYLTPNQASKIHKDAVAGVFDRSESFYAILVVEQALPMIGVNEYARFSYEELPVAEKKLLFFRSEPIQELPAAAFAFNGILDERFVDYEVEIIEYSGYYYHLVCFRFFTDTEKPRPALIEMKPMLRILQDKKPLKPESGLKKERFGIGFYFENNTCHDILHGFSINTAKLPGTFLIGTEATTFHPQTRFAVKHENARDYTFLIPAEKKQLQNLLQEFNSNKQTKYFSETCWLQDKAFLSLSTSPITSTNSLCPQLILMDEKTKTEKEKILKSNHFQILNCNSEQSFFHNRYRNHRFGLEFSFEKTDFVELWFEDDFGMDTTSSVGFTNHSSGFSGRFVFQENQFMERLEYHKSIIQSLPVTEPEIKESGPFLTSNFILNETGENIMLVSLIKDNLFFHAIFNRPHSENKISDIPLLFALGEFPEYTQDEKRFTHYRLAFSMNTEQLLQKPQIITPEEIKELGEALTFAEKQLNHTLYVLNSDLINPELVFDLYLSTVNPITISHETSDRIYKFLDLNVHERTFDIIGARPPSRLFLRTMRRGTTLFVLFTEASGNITPPCFFYDKQLLIQLPE